MSTLDARLIDLEIRYTHQERLLQELNDVVIEQRRAIDRLVAEVERLRGRLDMIGDREDPSDEPPPHY